MNPYTQNLNRIEFVITLACTGRCKHCSEGDHIGCHEHIDTAAAVQLVRDVTSNYPIRSLMTFGGEPLLHPDTVCSIHQAAKEAGIPKRQLITNGFFSKDPAKIQAVAQQLADSGVNDLLLSVDAFHQETIPLEPVKTFAMAVKNAGIPLRIQPAWLVSPEDPNPYNQETIRLLKEFEQLSIAASDGNIIFPSGNAVKYLSEYFTDDNTPMDPYVEDPTDVRTLSVGPNGDVDLLGGNIYHTHIEEMIKNYIPKDVIL
ncbi:MAG: radical SAM protein [Firmicutes bacterium]|nr:radical SAM protein [Bacillota bacterium]